MPERVTSENEVSLNGVRYRIRGPVKEDLSILYDPSPVSDLSRDALHLWDWSGGIGLRTYRQFERIPSRAWWSTGQLRYPGHLVAQPLVTATAAFAAPAAVGAMGVLANELYAAAGVNVYKYNNSTDSWGSSLATLPAVATDSITFRMNDVTYLAFATTSGYTYTSDGASYTDDTTDALYLAFWDDALWGIDATGQLWWSTTIGTEQNDAQLPLPNNSVTALFVARNADRKHVLFAATTDGLYAHNNDSHKWEKTELEYPSHPDNGKGSTRWRDTVHVPTAMNVFQYIQSEDRAIITVMGPDQDDGLPSDKRGIIRKLVPGLNELYAFVDGTAFPSTVTPLTRFASQGLASHRGAIADVAVGISSILGWNGASWECKWLGGNAQQAITAGLITNAYSTYRLWWAQNQRVYYMAQQRDILNPLELPEFAYAPTMELISPWFNAREEESRRETENLALAVIVEVRGSSSTEVVTVDYAVNYSESFTNLGTITSDGVTTYLLPNSTAPTGTVFRYIRLRVTSQRGSTTTLFPDVLDIHLEWRKKLDPKYVFTVELDLTRPYGDRTPKQLRSALTTAVESETKVEFTFRNDTDTDLSVTDRRYYVDVMSITNLQETGENEQGTSTLTLVET